MPKPEPEIKRAGLLNMITKRVDEQVRVTSLNQLIRDNLGKSFGSKNESMDSQTLHERIQVGVGKVVSKQSEQQSFMFDHWREGVSIEVRQAFTKIRIMLVVDGKTEDTTVHTMDLQTGMRVYGEANESDYFRNWILPCVTVKVQREFYCLVVDKEMIHEHL